MDLKFSVIVVLSELIGRWEGIFQRILSKEMDQQIVTMELETCVT